MNILRFFDKLENKIRVRLSRYPILYALKRIGRDKKTTQEIEK
ncbi:MAG: hypothetical protein AB1643_02535 [Patescibacteria group bacterium]